MTPKQEAFAHEYAIDRNGTQSAIRAGYEWPSTAEGFYVYFLMDGRTGEIFYVGKGQRNRMWQHRREARARSTVNPVKVQRILDCGKHLDERIFADGLNEAKALEIERVLILQFRHLGLTNVSSGNVHPFQTALARIDNNLDALRSFDDWLSVARDDQLAAAIKIKGSPEKFYAYFLGTLLDLREKIVEKSVAVNVDRHAVC